MISGMGWLRVRMKEDRELAEDLGAGGQVRPDGCDVAADPLLVDLGQFASGHGLRPRSERGLGIF